MLTLLVLLALACGIFIVPTSTPFPKIAPTSTYTSTITLAPTPTPTFTTCGDGICDEDEDCNYCSSNCGFCSSTPVCGDGGDNNCVDFSSGFEPDTYLDADYKRLEGTDNTTGFSWGKELNTCISNSSFFYGVSSSSNLLDFIGNEIVEIIGPHNNLTNVLNIQVKQNDPNTSITSRVEYAIYFKDPPNEFKKGRQLLDENK